MSSKSIRKIVYKTPEGLVETQYHSLYTDVTKLREEVQRLGVLEDRLNVNVVKILPETLEENVLYVVSDENIVDIKSILSRITSHDVSIAAINADIEGLITDVDSLNGRIDETSQVIGLKTTELNDKLDTMEADIDGFKERMNEQKTDFTANIVQLQDLTAKHTTDISKNASDIEALESSLEKHKTANETSIAQINAKDAEQDAILTELTGEGSGLSILDLKDTVQQNVDNIANHETRITKLETDVQANKEEYVTYVTSNNTRVKALEDTESTHNTALNTKVDNNNTAINTKVDTNRAEFLNTVELINKTLTDHDTRNTKNTSDISALQEEITSTNANTISMLKEKIDNGLANEVEVRDRTDRTLQDSVNAINTLDKDQNSRIKVLEEYTQNDFKSEINDIKTRAINLENYDKTLDSRVRAIQQFSSNHEDRIANLEINDHSYYNQRITALENTTANQKNRLDSIDILDTTQNNRLTSVETKNTQQDESLVDHNTRISDLEEHRDELDAQQREIVRDELDTRIQELETNYHDEMMTKVGDMTTDRLDELSTDFNEFKTSTNNSIQTFQGTLYNTLELIGDTQTEIKNTQVEQQNFLAEKTKEIEDKQLENEHYSQSYYEKFLEADQYNKELGKQHRLDKVDLYTTDPNLSEEVVETVTEYETVTEEIPEEKRDPEHPEITTREVQQPVERKVTHTVDHVQTNNSIALYETEGPKETDYTQYDYADLQAKIEALEATKNDYIDDIEAVNSRISEIENSDDKIEILSNKVSAVKSQVGGLGNLHTNTVERVSNLERYATLNDQKFNNYKSSQSTINTRQDDDLQSIHDYLDTNVEDLYQNYDKLQTQNQDDVVVLRKVVDAPATDETPETSHLELDSTEIIKVENLVDTKEELLRVRDLPVADNPITYLRGEHSEKTYVIEEDAVFKSLSGIASLKTKETYLNYKLDLESLAIGGKVIVSVSDDGYKKLEVRKSQVQKVQDEETVLVDKYELYYVQTDEYVNEDTNETFTEDTEIRICDVNPEDYVEELVQAQDELFTQHNYKFVFTAPIYNGSSSRNQILSRVDITTNNGVLINKGCTLDEQTRAKFNATDGVVDTVVNIDSQSTYISGYSPNYCRSGASWMRSNFASVHASQGAWQPDTYTINDILLRQLRFSFSWPDHGENRYCSEGNIKIYCDNVLIYDRTYDGLGSWTDIFVDLNVSGLAVENTYTRGY